jgi:MFS family permease
MIIEEKTLKQFRLTRLMAIGLLVFSPVTYVLIAWQVGRDLYEPSAGNDLVFYILLIVGAVSPALCPLIAKSQIIEFRKKPRGIEEWARLFLTLSIIRFAFAESSFIYGLVVYFLSHSFERMACFYAIGLIWAVVYWPRREKFEGFVQQGNQSV